MSYGNRGGYQQRGGGGGGYGGGNRQGGYSRGGGNAGGGQRSAPKDMAGSIRPNDNKQSDKHPDLKGSIIIAGRKYWLSGWDNEGPNGDRYIKLSASAADEDQSRPQAAPQRGQGAPMTDDDIPF